MYEGIFLEAFSSSNDFIINHSLAGFRLFQNTQIKHFSCNLYLLKSEIQDCRAAALEKKSDSFEKMFLEFLKS